MQRKKGSTLTRQEQAWARKLLGDQGELSAYINYVQSMQDTFERDRQVLAEQYQRGLACKVGDLVRVTPKGDVKRRYFAKVVDVHVYFEPRSLNPFTTLLHCFLCRKDGSLLLSSPHTLRIIRNSDIESGNVVVLPRARNTE